MLVSLKNNSIFDKINFHNFFIFSDEDIPATRKNFLDLLLEQDGEKLPDKELRDEVTTMVNVVSKMIFTTKLR